ncbi:DJ-1/PfpI family protein [Amycolatopsis jejuensis]|uniref:DJ-1/PfpI family protein n=1 Tax=Amycolatopsis jejuensis TaxID=330084 RepID=UPI00052522D2|nr:DJ-1/PfpI family protein [Amycolatopsis jejuensis]
MQIAVVLYDRFTALDLVGPYEVLAGLPGAEVVTVAEKPGLVTDDAGTLAIHAAAGLDEVPRPDVVLVPGGVGSHYQMAEGKLHEWLRRADRTSTWTVSVCTGSLILAAAGLLTGRRATSHWLAKDQLALYGATPVDERVVLDGHYLTAAGVSAGIDMGLILAGKIAGEDAAQTRQLMMEYAPEPPFRAGSPGSAPERVVGPVLARREALLTGTEAG